MADDGGVVSDVHAAVLARARLAVAALGKAELAAARWSGLGGRRIEAVEVRDAFQLGEDALVVIEVPASGATAPVLLTLPVGQRDVWRILHDLATLGGSTDGARGGRLVGRPGGRSYSAGSSGRHTGGPSVRPVEGDQSHTSVVIDERSIMKLYRRLTPGPNPEAEVLRALAALADAPTPPFRGAVDLVLPGEPVTTIAIEQAYMGGVPDAFEALAEDIAGWLVGASSEVSTGIPVATGWATGRLHGALAGIEDAAFRPRPATIADRTGWLAVAEGRAQEAVRAVTRVDPRLAVQIQAALPVISRALRPLGDPAIPADLQRIHGDLHLGQVLPTPGGVRLIDFEGDPTRDPLDRRAPQVPLRDVASFLRSIDHVARSGVRRASLRGAAAGAATVVVEGWISAARSGFLAGYAAGLAGGLADGLAIPGWTPDRALLRALEVEKELGEFVYAATFLPAWLYAPTAGLRALLGPVVGEVLE